MPFPEQRYAQPGAPRMALLLVSAEERGFAVTHAAEAMGVPLFVTRDFKAAVRQPMLVIPGEIPGAWLDDSKREALIGYVNNGGVLVMDDPEARVVLDLGGAKSAAAASTRFTIHFEPPATDVGLTRVVAANAQTIVIGNAKTRETCITNALTPLPDAKVLARFEDGEPAMLAHAVGRGHVYLLGASFYDLLLRAQMNRNFDDERFATNHFEPSADVMQIVLADWYLGWVRGAVLIDPIPDDRQGALVVTHDVDYKRSVGNMAAYVDAERAAGVSGTFFIQTKYIRDYEDEAFFLSAGDVLRSAYAQGADLGSHSVAHAYDFMRLPRGTEAETASDYRPRVAGKNREADAARTENATVAGELRVSKQVLQAAVPAMHVLAFRSGYLFTNKVMWSILERAGYLFDSSFSANEVMTSFPYRMMDEAMPKVESTMLQIPVLLSDAETPMMPVVARMKAVLDDEAMLHAVCVLLIHPDVIADKLDAERALIEHVRGRFWTPNIDQLGAWWNARGQVVVSVTGADVRLKIPPALADAQRGQGVDALPLDGLTLRFGRKVTLRKASGCKARPTADGRGLVLTELVPSSEARLELEK